MSTKGIKHIFFDLDHTIWDFDTNSKIAFEQMFIQKDLEDILQVPFDQFHKSYIIHNRRFWDLYSLGKIDQADLRWRRMYETLNEFKSCDEAMARSLSTIYLELLPFNSHLFPGTMELLRYLSQKDYQLHIVSNGFEKTQFQKLKHSNILIFFKHVLTSETCGFIKPDKQIFEHAMKLCGANHQECIMIGDSPEADLLGAYNAGIPSVYVDHIKRDTTIPYTYRVNHLSEIERLL
jgi:putative hydrolase of the HAD superfamily